MLSVYLIGYIMRRGADQCRVVNFSFSCLVLFFYSFINFYFFILFFFVFYTCKHVAFIKQLCVCCFFHLATNTSTFVYLYRFRLPFYPVYKHIDIGTYYLKATNWHLQHNTCFGFLCKTLTHSLTHSLTHIIHYTLYITTSLHYPQRSVDL